MPDDARHITYDEYLHLIVDAFMERDAQGRPEPITRNRLKAISEGRVVVDPPTGEEGIAPLEDIV